MCMCRYMYIYVYIYVYVYVCIYMYVYMLVLISCPQFFPKYSCSSKYNYLFCGMQVGQCFINHGFVLLHKRYLGFLWFSVLLVFVSFSDAFVDGKERSETRFHGVIFRLFLVCYFLHVFFFRLIYIFLFLCICKETEIYI